jgi:hypothetical protein
MANSWEFPGGKIEQSEMTEQALKPRISSGNVAEGVRLSLYRSYCHSVFLSGIRLGCANLSRHEGQPVRCMKHVYLREEECPKVNIDMFKLLGEQASTEQIMQRTQVKN